MNREMVEHRWRDLPEPIRAIGRDNVIVYEIMNRYVNGQIITKEEALCQMIVGLVKDWKHEYTKLVEAYQQHMTYTPITKL